MDTRQGFTPLHQAVSFSFDPDQEAVKVWGVPALSLLVAKNVLPVDPPVRFRAASPARNASPPRRGRRSRCRRWDN
jgi:hypothetical protein